MGNAGQGAGQGVGWVEWGRVQGLGRAVSAAWDGDLEGGHIVCAELPPQPPLHPPLHPPGVSGAVDGDEAFPLLHHTSARAASSATHAPTWRGRRS